MFAPIFPGFNLVYLFNFFWRIPVSSSHMLGLQFSHHNHLAFARMLGIQSEVLKLAKPGLHHCPCSLCFLMVFCVTDWLIQSKLHMGRVCLFACILAFRCHPEKHLVQKLLQGNACIYTAGWCFIHFHGLCPETLARDCSA